MDSLISLIINYKLYENAINVARNIYDVLDLSYIWKCSFFSFKLDDYITDKILSLEDDQMALRELGATKAQAVGFIDSG